MSPKTFQRLCLILAVTLATSLLLAGSGCSLVEPARTSGESTTSSPQPTTTPLPSATPEPSQPTDAPTATPVPATTEAPEPSATSEPEPTPSPSPSLPPEGNSRTYAIQPGDTLSKIAQLFGVTIDEIVIANNLSDPDHILAGQVLVIPSSDSTPPLYSHLDNTPTGWRYFPPDPLNQDIKATIPAQTAKLVDQYAVIWQQPQASGKTIYLTMDAGYEYNNNTTRILDIVKKNDVTLTFFVTGSFIANNPGVVLRMLEEGHQVGNHTERHFNMPKTLAVSQSAFVDDIVKAQQRFYDLTGNRFSPYLRPPEGAYSERTLALLQDMGYQAVFWSFAYNDWRTDQQPDPDQAYDKIMGQLHHGSVLLLHTVSDTNVVILERLIDGIRARGYTISALP